MSKFKNMKFRVENEEHSEEIQELLFDLGYRWIFDKERGVYDTSAPFLFADSYGDIYLSYTESDYHDDDYEPTTLEQLKEMFSNKVLDDYSVAFGFDRDPNETYTVRKEDWEILGEIGGELRKKEEEQLIFKIAKHIAEDNGSVLMAEHTYCPVNNERFYTLSTINKHRGDKNILRECVGSDLQKLYDELSSGKEHSYTLRWKDEDNNPQQSYYYGNAEEVCVNFLSTHNPREFTVIQNADA